MTIIGAAKGIDNEDSCPTKYTAIALEYLAFNDSIAIEDAELYNFGDAVPGSREYITCRDTFLPPGRLKWSSPNRVPSLDDQLLAH